MSFHIKFGLINFEIVVDLEVVEFILSDIFSESTLINPRDHAVLMVVPAIQKKENRIKAYQFLFVKFGFKVFIFQKVIIYFYF